MKFPISNFQFPVIFFSIFYVLSSTFSFAQQNSPYSRYGLGELRSTNLSVNKSMGGISSAFASPTNINFNNPASYAAIKYTSFETGIFFSSVKLQTAVPESQTIENANLSHIAFAFPATKKWTLTTGLLPFSRMDYDIDSQSKISSDSVTIDKNFNGNGSLYQLFIGNAFQFGKFSVGMNVNYLFGKLYRQSTQLFSPAAAFYLNDRKTTATAYSDILWNAGIQYTDTFSKDILFRIGANSRTTRNVGTVTENVIERIDFDLSPLDTISSYTINSHIVLPANYGIGFVLKKENKWQAGVQLDYGQWSKYSSFGKTDTLLVDNWLVGIGGEITPNYKSTNYFKQIQYRAGFYFGNDYLKLYNTQLKEYGMTFGFGLPVRRTLSRISLGFEIGQRGTTENNLIKENFFKAHIGITINDVWFIKRKFD